MAGDRLTEERWSLLEKHQGWGRRPVQERNAIRLALMPYVRVCTQWGEPLLGKNRIHPQLIQNAVRYAAAADQEEFELLGRMSPSG